MTDKIANDSNLNEADGYQSITIKNFKSYKNATLPLAPLTLLIGANASGKSNAIEALRFLSWVAGGERLTTLKNRVNDSDKVVRGSVRDLVFRGKESFTLEYSFSSGSYEAVFEIDNREVILTNEVVSFDSKLVFFIKKNSPPFISPYSKYYIDSLYDKFDKVTESLDEEEQIKQYGRFCYKLRQTEIGKNSQITRSVFSSNDMSSFANYEFEMDIDSAKKTGYSMFFSIMKHSLTSHVFFDFVPSLMNQDSIQDTNLRPDGSNLAGVMYQMCQDNPENKQRLLTIIQSLPEQHISDIVFYPDRRGRVEFALVESYGNDDNRQSSECPMDLLSDGTLKALAIATALLSVPEGATLVIEEIDNSIHPSRAHEMLSLMRQIANERHLKLLLSTHNPALMDALPDEALADVVFCYRDPVEGDSRLIRLGDLEDYVGLTVQGSLGKLVTKGIVERFVKQPTTSEQRKQKAMEWLESIWEDD